MTKIISFLSLALLICASQLTGCSISASIESSSDIISSPFSSSSGDDGGDDDSSADEVASENVTIYTQEYVNRTGMKGDADTFYQGLREVTQQAGITDWDANPMVWFEVGRGLHQSTLPPEALKDTANRLANGDPEKISLIIDAYNSPVYQY